MAENYQAVYDAVRGTFRGVDVTGAIERAFDISHIRAILQQDFAIAAYEMARPSVLYRPTVAPDGSKWHALYGPNQMEGVSGFGDTPAEAMADFDKNWLKQRTPAAICTCSRCWQWIEPGTASDGCRNPDCPKREG